MKKLKIFHTIIKPLLNRGIGGRFPFLRNLFYRQFSRLVVSFFNPITITSTGGGCYKLHLPPNGIDYLIEPYEEFEMKLMVKNLKPGDTFLDIGGGIGYHTVLASKIVGSEGRVIVFEPDPQYFKFIQKNLKENECNNVVLFQKAVSNRTGKTKFYLYDKIGRNRMEEVNYFLADFEIRDCIEVETTKIDDLLDEKVDFIKMDIEGSEYLALEGMKCLIKRNPEVKIISEAPDYKNLGFLRLLKELGFKIYEMKEGTEKLCRIENFEEFIKKIDDGKEEIHDLFCEK